MLTCYDVADYLLARSNPEDGDLITPLKLQKLVYYSQVVCLGLHDRPLFPEYVMAWKYGPVVDELYHHYKDNGNSALSAPESFDATKYSPEDQEAMDEVLTVFGQFSAWKLRDMTHEEGPWKDTKQSGVISVEAMRAYGLTLLK